MLLYSQISLSLSLALCIPFFLRFFFSIYRSFRSSGKEKFPFSLQLCSNQFMIVIRRTWENCSVQCFIWRCFFFYHFIVGFHFTHKNTSSVYNFLLFLKKKSKIQKCAFKVYSSVLYLYTSILRSRIQNKPKQNKIFHFQSFPFPFHFKQLTITRVCLKIEKKKKLMVSKRWGT